LLFNKLLVTRDSVSAGDDFDAPHRQTFNFSSPLSIEGAISSILASNYLASIAGGKAAWVVTVNGSPIAVVAQQWSGPRYIESIGRLKHDATPTLHFTYRAQNDPDQIFARLTNG
jgi:hypothetical protein